MKAEPGWIAAYVVGVGAGIAVFTIIQIPATGILIALVPIFARACWWVYSETRAFRNSVDVQTHTLKGVVEDRAGLVERYIERQIGEMQENIVQKCRRPKCCDLCEAGFFDVRKQAVETVESTLKQAENSYRFMGVSAEYVVEVEDLERIVKGKVKDPSFRFEVLLLDPKARSILEKQEPGAGGRTAALSIQKSLIRLKPLALAHPDNVEVRLYRDLPIFRIVLLDNQRAFVSFYGIERLPGAKTPQVIVHAAERSFLTAFRRLYTWTWGRANGVNWANVP